MANEKSRYCSQGFLLVELNLEKKNNLGKKLSQSDTLPCVKLGQKLAGSRFDQKQLAENQLVKLWNIL